MSKTVMRGPHEDTVRADPTTRRSLLLLLLVTVALGGALFLYLFNEIEQASASTEPNLERLAAQLHWMSLAFLIASALFASYLLVVAVRVVVNGQFPPPGARVARDTRIRRGYAARGVAALLTVTAIGVVLLSAMAFMLVRGDLNLDFLL